MNISEEKKRDWKNIGRLSGAVLIGAGLFFPWITEEVALIKEEVGINLFLGIGFLLATFFTSKDSSNRRLVAINGLAGAGALIWMIIIYFSVISRSAPASVMDEIRGMSIYTGYFISLAGVLLTLLSSFPAFLETIKEDFFK